jgi:toxin YoeB
MVKYQLYFTKQAQKDAKHLNENGLRLQAEKILSIIQKNPFSRYPPFEKLIGDLSGAYSRRINIHHRLVYQVLEKEKIIKVLRMWTHYGE